MYKALLICLSVCVVIFSAASTENVGRMANTNGLAKSPAQVNPQVIATATSNIGTIIPNLTGTWDRSGQGVYYIRQIGNDIWWVGISYDGGASFTNAFKGMIQGDTITGDWADTPHGGNTGFGHAILKVSAGGNEIAEYSDRGTLMYTPLERRIQQDSPHATPINIPVHQ